MQAIRTKYLSPTNTRGARIQAKCEAMTITVPYDDGLDTDNNHKVAASELCRRMDEKIRGCGQSEWTRPRAMGWFNGACYHVFLRRGAW